MSDTDIIVTISDATDINVILDNVGLSGSSGTSGLLLLGVPAPAGRLE